MSEPFTDPGPPPEPSEQGLRAQDLKNRVCIFMPVTEGEWEERVVEGKKMAVSPYIECRVWVLDRHGVEQEADRVRISWWRAVPQLRERMGGYVAAKVVENEDRSITLNVLSGDARSVARQAMKSILSDDEPQPTPPPPVDDEEPF